MVTSGKDTGIVGYNVQIAVDTQHHLIVAHEVTNMGTDRHQLVNMAKQARGEMAVETLEVVADRGYYDGEEIRTCGEAGITVTLQKPMTSGAKAAGRFGKQDFVYVPADAVYRCPSGERLTYHYTNVEDGKTHCAAIGQAPAKPARSKLSARQAPSAASHAGSMRPFWRKFRIATTTPMQWVSAVRQWSIRSAR
jgi:hypothetical protein